MTTLFATRAATVRSITIRAKGGQARAECYVTAKGRWAARIFLGRSTKPHSHFSYGEFADIVAKMATISRNLHARATQKAADKAADQVATTLKAGDILSRHWGYSMSLNTFWIVTKVIGARTVEIQKIGSTIVSGDGWQGTEIPNPEAIADEAPFRARVTRDRVSVGRRDHATMWNGRPCSFNTCD